MEYLFIYLLQVAEKLSVFNEITSTLLIGGLICYVAILITHLVIKNDQNVSTASKKLMSELEILGKKWFSTLLVLSTCLSFLPTKQTLLLMGGTYLGKKAVNTVITDEKIKKIDTIINLQLDKYIKELQGKEVK